MRLCCRIKLGGHTPHKQDDVWRLTASSMFMFSIWLNSGWPVGGGEGWNPPPRVLLVRAVNTRLHLKLETLTTVCCSISTDYLTYQSSWWNRCPAEKSPDPFCHFILGLSSVFHLNQRKMFGINYIFGGWINLFICFWLTYTNLSRFN